MKSGYWDRYWRLRLTRRRLLKAAALGGGGLALAGVIGCGDDEEGQGVTTTPAATPAATPAGTPALSPHRTGGKFTHHVNRALQTFDDQVEFAYPIHSITNHAVQALLRITPLTPTEEGGVERSEETIEGYLASEWEAPEPDVWLVRIADGARWQNIDPVNGRSVTADDVAANFARILDVESGTAQLFGLFAAHVNSVEAVDDRTARFNMKVPFGSLPALFAEGRVHILPREGIEGDYNLEEKLIGSGPWQLDSFRRDQFYRFKRNPDYWEPGLPYLDEVEALVIGDPALAVSALIAKELDAGPIGGPDLGAFQSANPDARVATYPSTTLIALHLIPTTKNAPMDDVRVRQAILHAINQDEIVERAYGGDGVSSGVIGRGSPWSVSEEEARELWGHDPAKSRQLLSAAGHPDGFDTSINWSTSHELVVGPMEAIAEVAARQLAEVGIRAELRPRESAAHHEILFDWGWEGGAIALNPQGVRADDPFWWLHDRFSVSGGHPWAQGPDFADQELQNMLDRMIQITDADELRSLVFEIQRFLAEIVLWVGTGQGNIHSVWQGNIHGYKPGATGAVDAKYLAEVWKQG